MKRPTVKGVAHGVTGLPGRVGSAVTALPDRVGSAYTDSRLGFRRSLSDLRESAIVPLAQTEPMPLELRDLSWLGKPNVPDPAAIVRKLRGRRSGPEARNELGCAYALLAWERSLDEYWLLAIEELQAAGKAKDPETAGRANFNLERVAAVSGFPV